MIWLQVDLFPQASVADQTRVITDFPAQLPGVLVSEYAMTGFGSQASMAVANPVVAREFAASQFMVMSAGQVITGAIISWIRIIWLQVLKFPQPSVALQVRVIVRSPAQLPWIDASV